MEPVHSGERVCANCGTSLTDGARFCPNCGTPAPVPADQPSPTQPGTTDETIIAAPPPVSSWDSPRFDPTPSDATPPPSSWETPPTGATPPPPSWEAPTIETPAAGRWESDQGAPGSAQEPASAYVPPASDWQQAEQATWAQSSSEVPPEKGRKTLWIILAILAVVILVCCCILPLAVFWVTNADMALQEEIREMSSVIRLAA